MVIAGKDRGKTGKVIRAIPREERVVVEGVNVVKRHRRPTARTRTGQIVDKAMPIHVSNVQATDPQTGKPSRIRIKRDSGTRIRISAKSGAALA